MSGSGHLYLPSAEPQALRDALASLRVGPDEMLGVLVGEQGAPDLEEIVATLASTPLSFFGGLFPSLIDGQERHDSGILLFTLPKVTEPMLVRGLDTGRFQIPDLLPCVQGPARAKPTALVLVDGLAPNIPLFLEAIYHQLGNRVSYWGGGAGSLTLKARPCVFTREGVHQGAAVVALSPWPARLGVRHGWRELKGPFVATRSNRNVIVQLNWRNAFELYQAAVEADAGVRITPDNFFRVASGYPFGIRKEGQEVVVRDPVAVGEGGTLICVGDVPENAVLSILKGEPERLVGAAGQAAREAASPLPLKVRHCLLADCVSRVLFLEDRFPEELVAIDQELRGMANGNKPLGMLTLGEISSQGEGYLEFFNKTSVVAVMHEP
ncbi:MAG: FIST C-terminal domain-containing protein [Myxococcota bacterium]